jgi:hypothetical protein
MACPFYQRVTSLLRPPDSIGFRILSLPHPESNACGLRRNQHAPCYMRLESMEPDGETCIIHAWLTEEGAYAGD